jgi:hypothetical protein
MNKLIGPFAKTLFALFILAVLAGVMYYSFHALGMIFPGDLAGQLFGMALFDVASLVWFLNFIGNSRSIMQYVFSGLGFLIGLVGTLGLVAIEVGVTSGLLQAADMAKPLNYIFIAALIGHLILIYATHAAEPSVSADISFGVDQAQITARAQKDAEQMLENNQAALAAPIAQNYVRRVLTNLNLQPRSGEVLDLQALDIVQPAPQPQGQSAPNFLSRILSGLGNGARKFESSVKSVEPTSPLQTRMPSPAAEDVVPGDGANNAPKS